MISWLKDHDISYKFGILYLLNTYMFLKKKTFLNFEYSIASTE